MRWLVVLLGGFALLPVAKADTAYTLDLSSCACGVGPWGMIDLLQTTPGLVTVKETLAAGERFAGTGAGDSLEFNVTGAGAITIGSITAGFGIGPAPDTASTYGTFLYSVTCNVMNFAGGACHGGQAGNPAGPLSFTVTSLAGVTIADFTANLGGVLFASDIVGRTGNTGNVAAGVGGTVQSIAPEPGTLTLAGLALAGLGLLRRRGRKR
jgi:hypothetical protein